MEVRYKSFYDYRVEVPGLPPGVTVSSAKFYVKTAYSVADASAIFTETATVTYAGGTGIPALLTFNIDPTNTDLCTVGTEYVCGVKVFLSNNQYQNLKDTEQTFKVVYGAGSGSS